MVILWAAGVALFMATLNVQNVTPDLMAAVRTTIVVILGWSFACCRYGFKTWSKLALPVRYMLIVSALAVILAWIFHLWSGRKDSATQGAAMDRINIGFAALLGGLLLWQRSTAQSAIIGLSLVVGTLTLAFAKK